MVGINQNLSEYCHTGLLSACLPFLATCPLRAFLVLMYLAFYQWLEEEMDHHGAERLFISLGSHSRLERGSMFMVSHPGPITLSWTATKSLCGPGMSWKSHLKFQHQERAIVRMWAYLLPVFTLAMLSVKFCMCAYIYLCTHVFFYSLCCVPWAFPGIIRKSK